MAGSISTSVGYAELLPLYRSPASRQSASPTFPQAEGEMKAQKWEAGEVVDPRRTCGCFDELDRVDTNRIKEESVSSWRPTISFRMASTSPIGPNA
ncbi:hypothetical protein CTheo_6164 [Ceratobasidium theobromae]|uniref:Uncharacterized protein n=1 Tax=Ceratobasidium theobromae TaxID=1582974 RepID=A0A5N5QFZ4_9AGAM|nr:hypothetical protein CTheo_6164 [Ceratobasidium theobromae]